jgi:tyramine---L-glutamate ligase
MSTIFVYEFCCASGLGRDASDPAHSLFREGQAMRDALVDDFRRLPAVQVLTLDGTEASDEPVAFRDHVAQATDVVVIAPELNGILMERCQEVVRQDRRLLGPSLEATQLTADKLALSLHWHAAGVPTPRTEPFESSKPDAWPVVVKPRLGAGSTETTLVNNSLEWHRLRETIPQNESMIVQPFVPGWAASVAFLIGPKQTVPLLPGRQVLSSDGHFHYLGGEMPLDAEHRERAISIARTAVSCVPGLRGYVGVDLILSDSGDVAIEINPRLTTSYVGLRHLARFNLAEAFWRIACGEPWPQCPWAPGIVRFYPDGRLDSETRFEC